MEKSMEKRVKAARQRALKRTQTNVSKTAKKLPTSGMSTRRIRILHNYTGNLTAAVLAGSTGTLSKRMASLDASKLMGDNQFRLCIEVLDEAFEKYGLMSALELREWLDSVIQDPTIRMSDRLKAASMTMTTKGMLESKLVVEQNSTNTKRRELIINITGGGAMSIPIEHCKQTLIG